MSRVQVTLRGEDAERFESVRDDITERRNGYEASNAEVTRLLMCAFEIENVNRKGVGY